MKLKKYLQFINESDLSHQGLPNPSFVDDDPEEEDDTQEEEMEMLEIPITKDEESQFDTELILQDLVRKGDISYTSGKLSYVNDESIVDIIKPFFAGLQ